MEALESRPNRIRRRDMFRPFIDCWNSYIAYASRQISRMHGATVHVARLDISRFYDELPRAAVETPLRSGLQTAMTRSGVNPAGLFLPDVTDAATRAEALATWLLHHSMGDRSKGYSYFHPRDGHTKSQSTGRKGLPQGPALSAYLANIALFGLDQAMADEILRVDKEAGLGRYGGLYARYVDDIILAAPSEAELRSMVRRVEGRVNALGLRLNEKSEILLPKTKAEARDWLVERRGAGFFEYGDAAETPTPVLDVPSSWGDAPGFDRRAALHVVLNTGLDDPDETSKQRLLQALHSVAAAAESPYGDFGHIARRLWLRTAIEEVAESPNFDFSPIRLDAFAEQFVTEWMAVVPIGRLKPTVQAADQDDQALAESLDVLAILDGAERLLMGAPHRNPTISEVGRQQISVARKVFVLAVAGGLLGAVIVRILNGRMGLAVQLHQAQAFLEARAAGVARLERWAIPARPAEKLPVFKGSMALDGAWIGQLALFDERGPDELLDIIEALMGVTGTPDAVSRLLNVGLAYIQALGRLDGSGQTGISSRNRSAGFQSK